MDILAKRVDSLYEYRDNFFNVHKISEAPDKPRLLKERLDEVLEEFENADCSLKSKAEYFMLKGKALNVVVDYDMKAEEFLSRAVKLDPMLSEAWTCLGDCYWKNDKFEAAKDCFVSSMSHKKNKEALRYLSSITRAVSSGKKTVEDSVQMAKEALQMDLNDGLSWLTLGNAYLAKYFNSFQDPATINQALSAYNRAEHDLTTKHNYTLFYNKASAHEFLENFEEALLCYHSTNQLNPTFAEGQQKEASMLKYLTDVTSVVRTKGKIREKRLKILVNKINPSVDMGTFAATFTKNAKESFKNINELCEGANLECLLVGRVVGSVFSEGRVPQTFFLVDVNSECTAVTLYNVAQKWGVCVGDSVVINEPTFKNVSFKLPTTYTKNNTSHNPPNTLTNNQNINLTYTSTTKTNTTTTNPSTTTPTSTTPTTNNQATTTPTTNIPATTTPTTNNPSTTTPTTNNPSTTTPTTNIPATTTPTTNIQATTTPTTNNPTTTSATIYFPLIRVDHPSHLIINSRKPPNSSIAPTTLSLTMLSE